MKLIASLLILVLSCCILSANNPTDKQLAWLRANCTLIKSVDRTDSQADLMPLKAMIGNARIVGLGEATHGSKEFFKMKHRLIEFLVNEMGFTIFAIEANLPECARLNEYILTGKGEPKELLKGLHFWIWNTQEVLDLILWMRQYNQSGKGQLQFVGIDCQYPEMASVSVANYFDKLAPEHLPIVKLFRQNQQSYQTRMIKAQRRDVVTDQEKKAQIELAQHILSLLENNRNDFTKRSSSAEFEWIYENARIIYQSQQCDIEVNSWACRDQFMYENLEWILKQNPSNAKMILWAHNRHISQRDPSIGWHLNRKYQQDYFSLGFAFHEGQYNAFSNAGVGEVDAKPSYPGTLEWFFHKAGINMALLELKNISTQQPDADWLTKELEYRCIGAAKQDGFYNYKVVDEFDALIFIDVSTPSTLLSR